MGHVIGSFGVYGWVKVFPYTQSIDTLMEYSSWWLSKENHEWQEAHVVKGQRNGSILHAKLKEYTDRTQAQKLKGMQIAIPRNQLPVLPEEGECGYYWHDLIGADVINLQNEALGKIVGLLETGANDVLRIQGINKKKEILIPFIEQVIIKVDLKLSRIVVDWGTDY
ncbi:16S rRNA processing protein RimM [Nitrosomonas sp. Nm166]|nr:16S rRNA processing protein RimM [Nitrosomonas sp. Nm166]